MNFKTNVQLLDESQPFLFIPTEVELFVAPPYDRFVKDGQGVDTDVTERVFDVQVDLKQVFSNGSTLQSRNHTFPSAALAAISGVDDKLQPMVNWAAVAGLFESFGLKTI